MSDKDLAIGVATIPNIGVLNKKPPHLVFVEMPDGKNKSTVKLFLSLDKPIAENGLLLVKGFLCDSDEATISKNYNEIIAATSKDYLEENLFPLSRIIRVKNLVYKQK